MTLEIRMMARMRAPRDPGSDRGGCREDPPGRRDSIDGMAEVAGSSDLSKIWTAGGGMPGPRSALPNAWPAHEQSLMLLKPPDGQPVTARLLLDFFKRHLVMLSQGYYPLLLYIDDAMVAYIETFYKEENLR